MSKIPVFDNLAEKARTQKNTIKIGGFSKAFWKTHVRRETAILENKKPKPDIPVIIIFSILYSVNKKNPKIGWKPIVLVF